MECAGRRYPKQTAVLTQGPLVEFLLFAAADVENPERVRWGKNQTILKMSFSDDSWTFQKHAHVPTRSPDAAVLTAHSGILAGGVHTHVVQGGLAHHVVGTPELGSSFSL